MTNDCQCVTILPADERGSLLFSKNKTPAFGCFLQRGWGFFVYCERHLNECTFLFFTRWRDPFPSCYFVFSVLRKEFGPIAQALYCYRNSLETFLIRFPQRPAMLWKTFSATRFFALIKRVTTNLLSLPPGNRRHKFQGVYPKLPLPVEWMRVRMYSSMEWNFGYYRPVQCHLPFGQIWKIGRANSMERL